MKIVKGCLNGKQHYSTDFFKSFLSHLEPHRGYEKGILSVNCFLLSYLAIS